MRSLAWTKCLATSTSTRRYSEEGVTDFFEQYAEVPGAILLPDFFLLDQVLKDVDPELLKSLTKQVAGQDKQEQTGSQEGPVAAVFASASSAMTDDIKNDLNATLHFVISNKSWTLISKRDQEFKVLNEQPEKADVT